MEDKVKKTKTKKKTTKKETEKKTTKKEIEKNKPKKETVKKETKKRKKKTKPEVLTNPFKTEKGYLNETNTLSQYESNIKKREKVLEEAKITKKDSIKLIFFCSCVFVIFCCAYALVSLKNNSTPNLDNVYEVSTYTYVPPFDLKANQEISEKQLKDMITGNARIFKYMAIVKDKTNTTLTDLEKIRMTSYMLFYSNNDELMSNCRSNSDQTYIEIPVTYLDKYVKRCFDGEVNYTALGIEDYYYFENNIYFNEQYGRLVKKEYDKKTSRNIIEIEVEDVKTSKKIYVTLSYLLNEKNFQVTNIQISDTE